LPQRTKYAPEINAASKCGPLLTSSLVRIFWVEPLAVGVGASGYSVALQAKRVVEIQIRLLYVRREFFRRRLSASFVDDDVK
jgi:hypothetical protein